MVTTAEVEAAIAQTIAQWIYTGSDDSAKSRIGLDVKICRGWPQETELGKDMMSDPGVGWVTVNQKPGTTIDRTRYRRGWRQLPADMEFGLEVTNTKSLNSVSFSGTAASSGVAGVVLNNVAYPVQVTSGQSSILIAQSIAAQVATVGKASVTCSGAILSVEDGNQIYGRVGQETQIERELARIDEGFLVSLFAPSITARDSIEEAVMNALLTTPYLGLDAASIGPVNFKERSSADGALNPNVYRLDLLWRMEFGWTERMTSVPALWPVGIVNSNWAFGVGGTYTPPVLPPIGAIRFDAWYDMNNDIDQQCAAVLSSEKWLYRAPANSIVSADGQVSWPMATQDTIDAEIQAAHECGLSFWAFDSYAPGETLSLALSLYLSSEKKSGLKFCMIGQSSNWGDKTGTDGYSAAFQRDISLMSYPDYMTVADGRPLLFVLDASTEQLSDLPSTLGNAIAYVRQKVSVATGKNPYVVILSGAAFADYDNTVLAATVGADAAGAYCAPRLNGVPQPYSALVKAAESDWTNRVSSGFPMVPTAMTGWDQRPLIENPQVFYTISSSLTDTNYYETADAADIATHVVAMERFIATTSGCPAGVGLVYAWNEFAEGGWLAPTYSPSGASMERVTAVGSAIGEAERKSVYPDLPFIT